MLLVVCGVVAELELLNLVVRDDCSNDVALIEGPEGNGMARQVFYLLLQVLDLGVFLDAYVTHLVDIVNLLMMGPSASVLVEAGMVGRLVHM